MPWRGRFQIGGSDDEKQRETWQSTQIAGVLLPFAFALYFADSTVFTPRLYPVGILLLSLSAVASWLSRVQNFPLLSTGAASGSVAVVWAWCLQAKWSAALAWEAVGICVGLALLFHIFFELDWRRSSGDDYQPFSPRPTDHLRRIPGFVGVHAALGGGFLCAVLAVAVRMGCLGGSADSAIR